VKLTDVQKKAVKKFSLGMKQRLGIAQALLGRPDLLILDEPTNGLDPSGIIEIRELIKSLPKEYGISVLLSSHILSEIELMATHVGIINQGKLLYQGSMADLQGKQKSVIQMVAEPRKDVETYLTEVGVQFKGDDQYLYIDPNVHPAKLNRELILNGYDVHQLFMKQDSLEEIFLAITGKEGRR
jgi:ABC-2 type transport system ATP-binding protein